MHFVGLHYRSIQS